MIEYDKFQKSLNHLKRQFENYQTLDPKLPSLIQEGVAGSVIQRFETCYDCMWKVLKRHLIETLGVPDAPNSPKPIFRLAFENGLLASDVSVWLRYADVRTDTAHDYSGEKASVCLAAMDAFIKDAVALYQTMSGESWE